MKVLKKTKIMNFEIQTFMEEKQMILPGIFGSIFGGWGKKFKITEEDLVVTVDEAVRKAVAERDEQWKQKVAASGRREFEGRFDHGKRVDIQRPEEDTAGQQKASETKAIGGDKQDDKDDAEKLLASFGVLEQIATSTRETIKEIWSRSKRIFLYEVIGLAVITILFMIIGYLSANGDNPAGNPIGQAISILHWIYFKPYSLLLIVLLLIIPVAVIKKEKKDTQRYMIRDMRLGGFTIKFQVNDEKMAKLREVISISCAENANFFVLEVVNKSLRIFFYYICEAILLLYFIIYVAPMLISTKISCDILVSIACVLMFVANMALAVYSIKRLLKSAARQNLKSAFLGMARYEGAFPTPMDAIGTQARYY